MALVAFSTRVRQTLLAGFLVSAVGLYGCGANNLTSPGSTTPSLAQPQGNASSMASHKSLKGTVLDALTEKPVKATLLVTPLEGEVSLPDASASTPSVSPSPSTKPSLPPSSRVKTDDKGKWEVKDLPDGPFSLLVTAPNYQAITLVNARGDLEISLLPQSGEKEETVSGQIKRPNGKPANEARIAASFLPGLTSGDAQDCNAEGSWKLALPSGKVALAAFTASRGEVDAFSFLPDVPVKEKADDHPLTLHAVAHPVIFSGESEGTLKPQRVQAYLTVEHGEIPLLIRAIDGRFRLSLPELPHESSYHLLLSTKEEEGTSFAHLYGLKDSDLKLSAALLPIPEAPSFDGKAFHWETVPSATFYRLRVEEESGKTLWEGYTTSLSLDLPDLSLEKKKTYRYSLTAIKTDKDWASVIQGPWSASSSHIPLEFQLEKS